MLDLIAAKVTEPRFLGTALAAIAAAATAFALLQPMLEPDRLGKRIKLLERQMLEHAKNLEFEKAARTRDQLAALREQAFGASVHDNVVALPSTPGNPTPLKRN